MRNNRIIPNITGDLTLEYVNSNGTNIFEVTGIAGLPIATGVVPPNSTLITDPTASYWQITPAGLAGDVIGTLTANNVVGLSGVPIVGPPPQNNEVLTCVSIADPFVLWNPWGTTVNSFTPENVYPNALGLVYVVDKGNNRVVAFDQEGLPEFTFGAIGSGIGQFNSPSHIAIDNSGSVYVTDSQNHRVQKFDGAGNYINQWGVQGSGVGQFNGPAGVATDIYNNLVFVSDTNNCSVQAFTTGGQYLFSSGVAGISGSGLPGSGVGQFNAPNGMAVSYLNNTLYVADSANQRVAIMNYTAPGGTASSGFTSFSSFGISGSGNGQFINPQAVMVDPLELFPSGSVYVSDLFNSNIQKFDANGTYLSQFGTIGVANGELNGPVGMAIDTINNMYVAESLNNRAQKFNGNRNFVDIFGGVANITTLQWLPNSLGGDFAGVVSSGTLVEISGIPILNNPTVSGQALTYEFAPATTIGLTSPTFVTEDRTTGYLYVYEESTTKIFVFNTRTNPVTLVTSWVITPNGSLNTFPVTRISYDSNNASLYIYQGNLNATNTKGHCTKYNPATGAVLATFNSLAVDSSGLTYIASVNDNAGNIDMIEANFGTLPPNPVSNAIHNATTSTIPFIQMSAASNPTVKSSGFPACYGYGLPGPASSGSPLGISVDVSGNIWTVNVDNQGNYFVLGLPPSGSVPGTLNFSTTGSPTQTTNGPYTVLQYNSNGSFIVNGGSAAIQTLVVAGGGSGGNSEDLGGTTYAGGGGGAGGVIYNSAYGVGVGTYNITVGAGGGLGANAQGGNSTFGPLTAVGGGVGGYFDGSNPHPGGNGGSGGGGFGFSGETGGGNGTASQGNQGGTGYSAGNGAGGGGATAIGTDAGEFFGGGGGNGLTTSITGTAITYGGGGGGGNAISGPAGSGGTGGGGTGATTANGASAGTDGLGGGGGGGSSSSFNQGNAGGKGTVILSVLNASIKGFFYLPTGVKPALNAEANCPGFYIYSDPALRYIYVPTQANTVAVFDWNGNYINSIGTAGSQPGQLNTPQGITADLTVPQLFIADKNNSRIDAFTPSGVFIDEFIEPQPASSGLYWATAIATPTGPAGGDLSNSFPNPTVAKINGNSLGSTTPTSGYFLVGNGSQWASTSPTSAIYGGIAPNVTPSPNPNGTLNQWVHICDINIPARFIYGTAWVDFMYGFSTMPASTGSIQLSVNQNVVMGGVPDVVLKVFNLSGIIDVTNIVAITTVNTVSLTTVGLYMQMPGGYYPYSYTYRTDNAQNNCQYFFYNHTNSSPYTVLPTGPTITASWKTIPPTGITPGTSAQILMTNSNPSTVWQNITGDLNLSSNGATSVNGLSNIPLVGTPVVSGLLPTYNSVTNTITWQAAQGGPPTGTAGGDLSGSYPNPTVAKVSGVPFYTVPTNNNILVANGTAFNSIPLSSLALTATPSGTAGGDLSGSYPNPTVSKINGVIYSGDPLTQYVLTANERSSNSYVFRDVYQSPILNGSSDSTLFVQVPNNINNQVLDIEMSLVQYQSTNANSAKIKVISAQTSTTKWVNFTPQLSVEGSLDITSIQFDHRASDDTTWMLINIPATPGFGTNVSLTVDKVTQMGTLGNIFNTWSAAFGVAGVFTVDFTSTPFTTINVSGTPFETTPTAGNLLIGQGSPSNAFNSRPVTGDITLDAGGISAVKNVSGVPFYTNPTAGNILVANGTNFNSVTLVGDIKASGTNGNIQVIGFDGIPIISGTPQIDQITGKVIDNQAYIYSSGLGGFVLSPITVSDVDLIGKSLGAGTAVSGVVTGGLCKLVHTAHTYNSGDIIVIASATDSGGSIGDVNQLHPLTVIDANSYSFPTTAATGNITGSKESFWFKGTRSINPTLLKNVKRANQGNVEGDFTNPQVDAYYGIEAWGAINAGDSLYASIGPGYGLTQPPTTTNFILIFLSVSTAIDPTAYLRIKLTGVI